MEMRSSLLRDVTQCRLVTNYTNLHCVTSQKSQDLDDVMLDQVCFMLIEIIEVYKKRKPLLHRNIRPQD